MSEHPIRNGVLATVLSAVVLGVGTWLLGYIPTIWDAIISVARSAWSVLAWSVPIPASLLVVGLLGLFVMWRTRRGDSEPPAKHHEPAGVPYVPSNIELQVLRAFAKADGKWIEQDDFKYLVSCPWLEVWAALERLVAENLVAVDHHIVKGTIFGLTASGRDFILNRRHYLEGM